MEAISIEEKIEMVLIYGECARHVDDAVALYADRFPENPRSRRSFYRVINQFMEEGSVIKKKRVRQSTVTGADNEIAVIAAVNANHNISSRKIENDSGISQRSVLRILKRHKYHPYHISLHQELHGNDFQNRVIFCQWARQQIEIDPNFFSKVLFSDESSFTNKAIVNRHNMHYWSVENPHWLREIEHQRQWSINVWCGIVGDTIVGPHFFEGTLNGPKYRDFLETDLPLLLEDLPLVVRQQMWFQHDGCPAHYSVVAREVLNRDYNGRWIGREGPVNWPARSPDLTSPDFCLWGLLKDQVYQTAPTTREDMMQRIINACARITPAVLLSCTRSFEVRINKCIEVEGHLFEHLLR